MIALLIAYLPLLLATVVLETMVVAGLTRRGNRGRAIAICVALNCVTHPIFTLLAWNGLLGFPTGEVFVTAFEAIGYASLVPTTMPRAVGLAIATNLLSACLGFVLSA